MSRSDSSRYEQYRVRLSTDEKSRLFKKSEQSGVPLSEAFRIGAEQYLDASLAKKKGNEETDPLLAEFRSLAARVESRLNDGRR